MQKALSMIMTVSVLLLAVSCAQAPKADEAKTSAPKTEKKAPAQAQALKIDLKKSQVTWVGTKQTGKSHNGTIDLAGGNLAVIGDDISAGAFVINMKSLKAVDMDEENNAKLAGHLMNEDFFEVEKYPTATFSITSVKPFVAKEGEKVLFEGATHTIEGNLTLKGKSNNISFPARVNNTADGLNATANFNIDRSRWGVSYGNDKSLGDRFILPEVNIGITLVANK